MKTDSLEQEISSEERIPLFEFYPGLWGSRFIGKYTTKFNGYLFGLFFPFIIVGLLLVFGYLFAKFGSRIPSVAAFDSSPYPILILLVVSLFYLKPFSFLENSEIDSLPDPSESNQEPNQELSDQTKKDLSKVDFLNNSRSVVANVWIYALSIGILLVFYEASKDSSGYLGSFFMFAIAFCARSSQLRVDREKHRLLEKIYGVNYKQIIGGLPSKSKTAE